MITNQFRLVFPKNLNNHQTLFGGELMKWMDEVAFMSATRYTRQKMVTLSCEKLQFKKAIQPGSIIEIKGWVKKAGAVKLEIEIEVISEDMYSENKESAIDATFVFAAIDETGKPVRIKSTKGRISV